MAETSLKRLAAAGAVLFLLAGCTGEERTRAAKEESTGSGASSATTPARGPDFSTALAEEYRKLVEAEERKYHDRFAAHKFLNKADAAQLGEPVPPEEPGSWDVGGAQGVALAEARWRLLGAMANDARAAAPELTAQAQVRYDCWVERAGSGFPERDVQECADDFLAGIGLVENAVTPLDNTPFNVALAREYLAYADYEAEQQGDRIDSRHFNRKGMRAAEARTNDEVPPEHLGRWNLDEANGAPELVRGRERLVAALDGGARDDAPVTAALAQVRFDCWVERSSERNEPPHIEKCRREFLDALAEIENGEPTENTGPALRAEYLVFFGFDEEDIRASEQGKIDAAAGEAQARDARKVTVVGHTDTAGPLEYNMALSLRRADAVRAALILSGVRADTVEVIARGETKPRVDTGNDVPKQANRRAEILLPPRSSVPTN